VFQAHTVHIHNQELIAKNKKIEIICEGDCLNKMIIKIDGEKIRQVFQNLVSNAIKYSPENSRIFWGHKDEKEKIIFFVKDSGLGIPLDQQKEIFDKFFRASNVLMTGTEGTGLGLYIAKSIVEAHGGKIWFESKEKEGTTFFLELPK
jgi:signal transduction histidine kinase